MSYNKNSFGQIFKNHYCTQTKLMPECDYISDCIKDKLKDESGYIFDIGSNQGLITLPLAYLFPDSKIFSFEPVKENYDLLIENLKANNIINVEAKMIGFGKKSGKFPLSVVRLDRYKKGNTGTYTLFHESQNESTVEADIFVFEDYLKDNLNIAKKIFCLKVDTEGAERFILTEKAIKTMCNLKFVVYETIKQEKNVI